MNGGAANVTSPAVRATTFSAGRAARATWRCLPASAGDYTFDVSGGGLASVTDIVGLGGTDTLATIERVQFGEGASMAILVDAPATDGSILATEASIILGGDGNDEIRGRRCQ